jgi:thioredoxin 1
MSPGGKVQSLTSADFDEVVSRPIPALIEFGSEFCSPCQAVGRALEEIAQQTPGRLTIAKVDVLAEPALAARYAVNSVPTVIILVDGQPVRRLVGARPASHMVRELEPYLAGESTDSDPSSGTGE